MRNDLDIHPLSWDLLSNCNNSNACCNASCCRSSSCSASRSNSIEAERELLGTCFGQPSLRPASSCLGWGEGEGAGAGEDEGEGGEGGEGEGGEGKDEGEGEGEGAGSTPGWDWVCNAINVGANIELSISSSTLD